MPDNTPLQIEALTEFYRIQIAAGSITRADLITKCIGAEVVMVDGTEMIAVANEGGSQSAQVFYPKEVVMIAALKVWRETDPDAVAAAAAAANDLGVVHLDFSRSRIET